MVFVGGLHRDVSRGPRVAMEDPALGSAAATGGIADASS
jgi:hypothetical protein